jgi:tRNA pseudouridine32 synthase/23S rRNA pseudouridine746 synthase
VLYAAALPVQHAPGAHISVFYTILDHQADFLVIDKAPGVAVQGDIGSPSVLEHVRRDLALTHLYPVHRLDMATSGLVVAAKTPEANRALSLAFQNQEISKCYLAITSKKPSKKQGWVIGDMEKARSGSYRLCRTRENPARTAFRSFALENGRRLFVLRPLTGKTHQLRVALKSLGAPIIGDERYGGEPADRMYLHAWRLEFNFSGNLHRYVAAPHPGALFAQFSLQSVIEQLNDGDLWRLGV